MSTTPRSTEAQEHRINNGPPKICTHSSATRAMATRKVVGSVHLQIRMLRATRQKAQQNELIIEKASTLNWSDALTEYLSATWLNTLIKGLKREFRYGRPSGPKSVRSSPQQQSKTAQKMMSMPQDTLQRSMSNAQPLQLKGEEIFDFLVPSQT